MAKVNKFKGIKFRQDYRPARFNHRNKSYTWKNLTREEIEMLAADPKWTLFAFSTENPEKKGVEKSTDDPPPAEQTGVD